MFASLCVAYCIQCPALQIYIMMNGFSFMRAGSNLVSCVFRYVCICIVERGVRMKDREERAGRGDCLSIILTMDRLTDYFGSWLL